MINRIRFYQGVLTVDFNEMASRHYNSFQLLRSTVEPYIGQLKAKTILDIGCGRLYPYTLLLHSLGNTVIGIDTAYIGYDETFMQRYWKELTQNGFESFGRALLYDLLRQRSSYYTALQKLCDFPLDHQGVIIKRMNAEDMTFPDGMFDLVVSSVCFEHIANVPRAVSELTRVLKSGGIAYIIINLFTSRSGGHQIGKQLHIVPPWDHLRQNKHSTPVYLNKLRKGEYLKIFSERLEILEVLSKIDEEGKKLLTPEIRSELESYSEEELLSSTITIVPRKLTYNGRNEKTLR